MFKFRTRMENGEWIAQTNGYANGLHTAGSTEGDAINNLTKLFESEKSYIEHICNRFNDNREYEGADYVFHD